MLQLLTSREVAKQLGFADLTLFHWSYGHRPAPAGFPKPIRVGRQLRYIGEEIDAWIRGLRGDDATSATTTACAPITAPAAPTLSVIQAPRRGRPRKTKPSAPSRHPSESGNAGAGR